tara:strand:- start:6197 stop:6619 length:423 start_codon:yes stop_codon:yes gene_type:complete
MTTLGKECEWGIEQEDIVKPILEKYFDEKLTKTENRYAPFDFYNNDKSIYIEVKSRKCNYDKYLTTIITDNKWKKGQKLFSEGKKVFYVFNFLDGIYILEYNKQEYPKKKAGRYDRGRPEIKYHIFIPIKDLTQILNKLN